MMAICEQTERALVVEEAKRWLGTPWHHQARVRGAGVDCGQFLIGVYSAVGLVKAFDPPNYSQDWALHRSIEKFLELVGVYCQQIEVPGPGDIALFKYGRCLSHAAIVLDWPRIIHARIRVGVLEEGVDENDDLARRHEGFWSIW